MMRNMTVKEFYENIHGDYQDIFSRISADELILFFVKQFPSDSSYQELMEAVKRNDIKASFEAAHKLKGLAANLSFSELFAALHDLSEQLRPQAEPADAALVQRVRENYQIILCEIKRLENGEYV